MVPENLIAIVKLLIQQNISLQVNNTKTQHRISALEEKALHTPAAAPADEDSEDELAAWEKVPTLFLLFSLSSLLIVLEAHVSFFFCYFSCYEPIKICSLLFV